MQDGAQQDCFKGDGHHRLEPVQPADCKPGPVAEPGVGVGRERPGIRVAAGVPRHDQVTRRDLLLAVTDLLRFDRVDARTQSRARGLRRTKIELPPRQKIQGKG